MGDGRYYTFHQFFDVILLTILSMFAIGSIVYFYYRKNSKTNIMYSYITFGLIAAFSIARVIETVIPSLELAQLLRNIENAIILISLTHLIFLRKGYGSIKTIRIFLLLFALLFAVSLFRNFVLHYTFHHIQYSYGYKFLLLIVIAVNTSVIMKTVPRSQNKIYGFIQIAQGVILIAYFILVLNNSRFIDYFEIVLFFCIAILLYFKLNPEFGLAMLAFDKIGDMSRSYIFVLDCSGTVIYQNKASEYAEYFNIQQKVDLQDICSIFIEKEVSKSSHLDTEYIMVNSNGKREYFTYQTGVLKESNQDIGSIITIIKITELFELLFSLEEKKETLKQANQKLKNYAKIVYHLEKEKEINHLLEEVIHGRDIQMKHLSQLISETKDRLDDDFFEKQIDITINKSNEVLEEVRETVSTYREYYGD